MTSFNKYTHVFEPIRIGNMTVKNRIQFSPMVSSLSTPSGGVSSELLGYVKSQARTGVGVITIGSTPIDHINGVDFFGALDVTSDDKHPLYRPYRRLWRFCRSGFDLLPHNSYHYGLHNRQVLQESLITSFSQLIF